MPNAVSVNTRCTCVVSVCFKKGVSVATASHLPKNRKSQKKILKSLTNLIVISHNLKPVKISYANGRVSVRIFYKNNLICFRLLTLPSYIELPDKIVNKKVVINIKNEDNLCFVYSVLCGLKTPEKDANRVSKYKDRMNELKYKPEDMPMDINKIIHFEKVII